MKKSKLQDMKMELISAGERYNILSGKLKDMQKRPEIIKYEKLKGEVEIFEKEYDFLSEKYNNIYMAECIHPLWFLKSVENDDYEQRKHLECKCLICGKEEIKRPRDNEELIKSDVLSYYDAKKEYNKLLSENSEEIAVVKIKKRFSK